MKFESIKSRIPREWRNVLRAASFGSVECSESSTIDVENEEADFTKWVDIRIPIRRAHFNEERNTVYANPEDDCYIAQDRWYTKKEIHMCRAKTRCLVILAGYSNYEEVSDETSSWSRCLEQKYLSLCSLQGDVGQEVTTCTVPPCHIATVGLERRVLVHTMARDKHNRRRRLLRHFHMIYDSVVDPEMQAFLIAQASVETSQPSRMFAAFLAEWWWHAKEDEQDD
eukprot:scaffold945_cov170-Amphora_coffeaeformis.AAC.28